MSWQRPVSANERLYLATGEILGPMVIEFRLMGRGQLDPERCQAAHAQLIRALPGLNLQLKAQVWTEGRPAPLHISDKALPEPQLDPIEGPTASLTIVQNQGQVTFHFRALHAVMDGAGLQIWAKAFFRILRGDFQSYPQDYVSDDDLIRETPIREEPWQPQVAGPASASWAAGHDLALVSLKGSEPDLLPKLAESLQRMLGDEVLLMVPVNLRARWEEQDRLGNHSLPLYFKLGPRDTAATFRTQLLTALESESYLRRGRWDSWYRKLPMPLLKLALKSLIRRQKTKYLTSAVISHLGRTPLDDFRTSEFQATRALALPCVMPMAPFAFVIGETADHCEIAMIQAAGQSRTADDNLRTLLKASGWESRIESGAITPTPEVQRSYPEAAWPLHAHFEQKARTQPESLALIWGSRRLSYRELDEAANGLAHELLRRGLSRGSRVAVACERSFALIQAILGILKAGCVYVPLDPSLPEARLQFIIEDSEPALILTQTQYAHLFSKSPVLDLTRFVKTDQNAPQLVIEPDDLAYMIYTSGSTGQAKGALNTHRAATNHFLWMAETLGLGMADRTLQKTPISFDASLLEILLPLQVGAAIVIIEAGAHLDADHMLQKMREHHVSFLSIVPSVLEHLLREMGSDPAPTLRLFLIGGEELSVALCRRVWERFPGAAVVNLYGPAEAAIDTLSFTTHAPLASHSVPIGFPVPNTRIQILDENGWPILDDAPGELIIEGMAIGAGYHRRPELTAERYGRVDGRSGPPFDRYRTGDIVRRLPDGAIEFLGRKDNQVKIQGARIELGEIEAALTQLPGVRQAVVVAPQSEGKRRLVAYILASPDSPSRDFREHLGRILPSYMVPSTVESIESWPLNGSGKIDRRQLEARAISGRSASGEAEALDDFQAKIAGAWQAVLGTYPELSDDFFRLGGGSLQAVGLQRRLEKLLGQRPPLQLLYENSRLSAMSSALRPKNLHSHPQSSEGSSR